MRDLFFVAFLGALFLLGLRRPFLMVLGYVYVDIVSPQHLSYYLLNSIPVSLIFFLGAVGGWLTFDRKQASTFSPRQAAMLVLLIYCYFTTQSADFPIEAAEKWAWVWKVLVFAIFLPLTITTRLRIEALATVMVLSAASIIIAAGIKTAASGGGYGVLNLMSDSNTGLYESSTLACVAISIIPFILYLRREGTIFPLDWRVTLFCAALIFACLLIPVGTEARTGLICIAVLGVMMLRAVKRRFLYLFGALVLGLTAIPFLPESFTKRMDTLNEVNADESASTRLAVWRWTLDYAGDHPFGGGFDSYRGNSFRYEARTSSKFDPNAPTAHEPGATIVIEDKGRAFHSAYFEMLGEQGWPGLAIWLFIHLTGLLRMEMLFRRYRNRAPEDGHWIAGLATALQQANVIYLIGAGFIGVAYLSFAYMLIAMQIALDAYARRLKRTRNRTPFHVAKAVPA
ncbi:putative O-glycosylation ligase, exosortase A system-associated [Chakrabartia godavariana]|nr:putative O-glycosylation ligase, exosortase A system-associated [Chakrabartia godavariana]